MGDHLFVLIVGVRALGAYFLRKQGNSFEKVSLDNTESVI